MIVQAITITHQEKAVLLPVEASAPLEPDEVRGRTLVSLVSPGTELAWNYLGKCGNFPNTPGYSAIFEIEEMGSNVSGIKLGKRMLCRGKHQSIQQQDVKNVISVPDGLAPEEAVLARLMGVTMTTLMTTSARPGDIILITGAGPVGYLCAHMFRVSGYDVRIVDLSPERRKVSEESGFKYVASSVSKMSELKGKVAMAIDCSGHEQAILDAAHVVRKGGELVLVGVPWKQSTDLTAHQLLNVVFNNYIVLRSGWEWELPHLSSDFHPHSTNSGFSLALRWLSEHRIPSQGLITLHQPENAQDVYQGLLHNKTNDLFQVFDWQDRND